MITWECFPVVSARARSNPGAYFTSEQDDTALDRQFCIGMHVVHENLYVEELAQMPSRLGAYPGSHDSKLASKTIHHAQPHSLGTR